MENMNPFLQVNEINVTKATDDLIRLTMHPLMAQLLARVLENDSAFGILATEIDSVCQNASEK